MVIVHGFRNTNSQGFHIASGHSAIRVKPFIDNHHIAQRVKKVAIIDGQPATNIDQIIFLGTHPGAIGVTAEFFENIRNRLVFISLLTLLDKESILHHTGRIKMERNIITVTQCP